jgi:hypothetical protein
MPVSMTQMTAQEPLNSKHVRVLLRCVLICRADIHSRNVVLVASLMSRVYFYVELSLTSLQSGRYVGL